MGGWKIKTVRVDGPETETAAVQIEFDESPTTCDADTAIALAVDLLNAARDVAHIELTAAERKLTRAGA